MVGQVQHGLRGGRGGESMRRPSACPLRGCSVIGCEWGDSRSGAWGGCGVALKEAGVGPHTPGISGAKVGWCQMWGKRGLLIVPFPHFEVRAKETEDLRGEMSFLRCMRG